MFKIVHFRTATEVKRLIAYNYEKTDVYTKKPGLLPIMVYESARADDHSALWLRLDRSTARYIYRENKI
jgi:hypothetical protein